MSTRKKNRRRTDSSSCVYYENWWRTDSQMIWDCFVYLCRRPAKIPGEPIHRCCTFVSMMKNWYVAQQPIHEMKISGGRSYSWKWTDHRVNWRRTTPCLRDPKAATKERERKTHSLNSLSASHVGLLALSRRKFSKKTSGPRVAANQFADDLKIVVQVVHTDGQGHSHRRFRGRLCSSLTACRTTKVVFVHCGLTGSPCRWTRS